jgi:hypothetical protein
MIENKSLLEQKHKYRFKEHYQYLSEYVLLPKFVFLALAKWYGCDVVLPRTVISYKTPFRSS